MSVADGFLPGGNLVVGIQREGDFDYFFSVCHDPESFRLFGLQPDCVFFTAIKYCWPMLRRLVIILELSYLGSPYKTVRVKNFN